MVLSMTGFSSLDIVAPGNSKDTQARFTMTLKSLNSRFFEVNCKLPHMLTSLETDLIKLFKSKLYRGNVYFTIYLTNPNVLLSQVEPSLNTLSAYLKAIEKIQTNFPITGSLSVSDLINLPDVFSPQQQPLNQDTIDFIIDNTKMLIETLNQARIKEGNILAQDLWQRINNIRSFLKDIEPRAQIVMEQKKSQLLQMLNSVLSQEGQITPETQNLVIYNQLDKIDIHEEIVRFNTHLDNFSSILQSSDYEKGKKIDFTLQELFREINTIASKCSDALISSKAIDIKVELEKAREQAQNIV